jgi:2-polyprenyl-3-methyl-5-hydroxy-6-metoxy-1,4-benzoquinol methylase
MSRISFENYGKRANRLPNLAMASGRYALQDAAQRRIVADVVSKLELRPEDRLLEIGCGIGALLVPLSFLVAEATGLDHPSCIERLQGTFRGENLTLVAGDFLDAKGPLETTRAKFDKILCYSVLHSLADEAEVSIFVAKAIRLLAPGGRALFGDLPNKSRKQRFLASPAGKAFEREWRKRLRKEKIPALPDDPRLVRFDDNSLLRMCGECRRQGLEAYILPQPVDLPFGHTREDLLVVNSA